MGTSWSAKIVDPAAPPADGWSPVVDAALDRIIVEMSQWVADSTLSRFNRAPVGSWQDMPADLRRVVDAGRAIGQASGGAFDIAGGALADLWGFGPPGARRGLPADADVAAALARSGGDAIESMGDRARRTRDVALDLSGIAKGFAVDAVAAALAGAGASDLLVEIGGEFAGRGIRPDGQPWWVDLETPPGISIAPLRIALHGLAVATSGDYRRFVAHEGRRLGHTIDPRTGRPIENGVVSASVIAGDCMTADGWATALTVLGVDAGMAAAERQGLAARLVTRDGREYLSPALVAMLG
ncbi:FAD:protein FMN transferase [Sphingomonas sp.]|uniref:FAD:protein FMN transferase n=1 Tax=Sphingomonas sp. TaxID=28214 RepID=UPI002DD68CCD|nr:FAD:protein FMN transferase [Sphingomonas sp.]